MILKRKSDTPYIFVYGTLRKHFSTPEAQLLKGRADWKGVGYIHGSLYDLGGYPGLVPSLARFSIVWGDVYKVNDLDIEKNLDVYEQVGDGFEAPYEYKKTYLPVYMGNKTYFCLVYAYSRGVDASKLIFSGDYYQHTGLVVV